MQYASTSTCGTSYKRSIRCTIRCSSAAVSGRNHRYIGQRSYARFDPLLVEEHVSRGRPRWARDAMRQRAKDDQAADFNADDHLSVMSSSYYDG